MITMFKHDKEKQKEFENIKKSLKKVILKNIELTKKVKENAK